MKRRLNLRFLACLLGALIGLGLSAYSLHAFQVHRTAGELLRRANRDKTNGLLQEALKSYRRYLQIVPNDADALADYGLTLDDADKSKRQSNQAFFVLEKSLRFNPNRQDVRRRIVAIAMDNYRFTDAKHHLEKLLEETPDNAELEDLLGRCLEGNGQFAEAKRLYQRAIEHEPKQVESYVHLVDLLRLRLSKANEDETDKTMLKLLQKNQSSQARVAVARYYRTGGSGLNREAETLTRSFIGAESIASLAGSGSGPGCLAAAQAVRMWAGTDLLFEAEQQLVQARAADPNDAEVLLESAEVARARNWLDQAQVYAREGLKQYPNDMRMYKQVADLSLARARPDEAIEVLQRGIELMPDQVELTFLLAELLIAQGKPDTIRKSAFYLAELKNKHVDPAILDYLDGHRSFASEEWLEASKRLERASQELIRRPELARQSALMLGRCYEQLGAPDRQYGAYRRALPNDPYDPMWFTASEGVARALLGMNKLNEALDVYRNLIPRAPATRLVVIRVLILRNMTLPRAQRDWAEVKQQLDEAGQQLPKSSELTFLRAQSLAAQNNFRDAKKLLDEAQPSDHLDLPLWLASAGLEAAQGKTDAAFTMVDEAAKKVGDRIELRLARLRFLLQSDSKEVLKTIENLENDVDKFSQAERRQLYSGLAEAYTTLGEFARAKALWERIAEQRHDDLGIRIRLFDLALLSKDDESARLQIQAIRKFEGEGGTLWRYGTAALLVSQAKRGEKKVLEKARPLLTEVATQRPTWARVPACQAQAAQLEGHLDEAIRYYLLAVELGERTPATLFETIRLLRERGRYAELAQVIQKLPEQTPLLKQLTGLIIDVALKTKDLTGAERLARQAVADNPDDYKNHLSLAQVCWAVDNLTEAETALRRAVMMADQKPETWTTLVAFLARTNRRKEAEEALVQAKSKLPEAMNRLTFAYCYDVLGQQQQAKDLYRAALQSSPRDLSTLRAAVGFFWHIGETPEAKRYLQTIITLPQIAPAEVASAKRLLALLVATESSSTYDEKRKVLVELGFLAETPEGKATESPDDKRARAFMLAGQGRRNNRAEAIEVLENLSKLQPLTASDQFLLAQLYNSLGNKTKVQALMLTVLSKEADNSRYLAYWAHWLLAQKEPEKAKTWVERLVKLQPKVWQTVELRARLLHAEGNNAEAIALLSTFAEEKNAPLLAIANLLEQIENKPKKTAERMYEKLVDKTDPMKKPDAILVLAGFLGRTGRLGEALNKCDQVRPSGNPETVFRFALLILYGTKSGKADWERVEGWMQEALAATKNDAKRRASVRQNLATLYNLQGRFSDAEKTYRLCLEENRRDVLSMNNLAWLLATEGKNPDDALSHIQRAIAILGPSSGLLDTRAIVYLAQGKSDLAVKELEEIVADNPTGAGYFHLAQAYYAAKNKNAARDTMQRAQQAPHNLQENDLHPFEREKYRQLLQALGFS